MEKEEVVVVNGRRYNAVTGLALDKNMPIAKTQASNQTESVSIHQSLQRSTTLNRSYIKKVTPISQPQTTAQKTALEQFRKRQDLARKQNELARQRIMSRHKNAVIQPIAAPAVVKTTTVVQQDEAAEKHPLAMRANIALAEARAEKRHMTAQELKDKAIKEAFERAAGVNNPPVTVKAKRAKKRHFWKSRRFAAMFSMGTAAVLLLGYLVYLNLPDISIRIAAVQAGVDATYPSYKPNGYSLKGLISYKNGGVEMEFESDINRFTLNQKKSSWDSVAVLNNYVKPEWGESYSISKEHGLIIYTNSGKAAWVSGGILYTIDGTEDLSDEQIRSIAVSL